MRHCVVVASPLPKSTRRPPSPFLPSPPRAVISSLLISPLFHRYSKKFKFRPAASPIVTQKLPDGRTRVRGDDVRRIKLAEDKAKKEGKGKKKN